MPIEVQRILAQSQRMLANRHEVEECIPASRIPQLTQTHMQRSEESLPAPDTSALCACVLWTSLTEVAQLKSPCGDWIFDNNYEWHEVKSQDKVFF